MPSLVHSSVVAVGFKRNNNLEETKKFKMILFQDSYTTKILPVFLSVLCDNLLLTVVVPILPELLRNGEGLSRNGSLNLPPPASSSTSTEEVQQMQIPVSTTNCLKEIFHLHLLQENSQLGLLYSTKAFVQLIANPIVGKLTLKIGYRIPLCLGSFILFLCSLVFGVGESIALYTIGRSCHGLASSLITVSGMALVAEHFQDDEEDRTKILGRVMSAAALGVLIGYPFGGLTFSIFGKSVPFLCIAGLAAFSTVVQVARMGMDIHRSKFLEDVTEMTELAVIKPGIMTGMMTKSLTALIQDTYIFVIVISIWLTTIAMAVLEPTLPVWLMERMDPPKWQLGLVFVPDSLGYFTGTNFFGATALRLGRWKTSMASMAIIGISCFIIPMSGRIWQLAIPHFALGLALGVVDASLMPLLACLADEHHHAGYGVVYALAQTAVALAYSLGPLIGGELVPMIGFPDLMRTVGLVNLLFCPMLILLAHTEHSHSPSTRTSRHNSGQYLSFSKQFGVSSVNRGIQPMEGNNYYRFSDDLDSD